MSASYLLPLLMSCLESLGYLTELTPESTTAPSIDQFVGSAQGSILTVCVQMVLFCFSVI